MNPQIITNIEIASDILRRGGLVAIPTETVYGLAGDATNDLAIAKIFAAKNRPSFNPLIIHLPEKDSAQNLIEWNSVAEKLANKFWPGPLTMILPQKPRNGISKLAAAGLNSLGIRVPNHPIAQKLLRSFGRPLAAPSANKSGDISPTLPQHVLKSLGNLVDVIVDGGVCDIGLESTVIDLCDDTPVVLRLGGLPIDAIEMQIGKVAVYAADSTAKIKSPGQLLRHYAPSIPLRVGCQNPQENEALLAFGSKVPNGFKTVLNLSAESDLTVAAANLYKYMHLLDTPEHSGIATMPVPESGLGLAINDRLRRAAQKDNK